MAQSLSIIWVTMKAYLQGLLIKEISKVENTTRQWETDMMEIVKQAVEDFITDPTEI